MSLEMAWESCFTILLNGDGPSSFELNERLVCLTISFGRIVVSN